MIYDLQKASVLKRISAGILDFIVVLIIATGAFFLLSSIFNYDQILEEYETSYDSLIEEVSHKFELDDFESYTKMSSEERKTYKESLSEEQKIKHREAEKYFETQFYSKFQKAFSTTIAVVTFGILIAVLIVEFLVPLFLKNGQTIGKKVFSICLMMENGVQIKPIPLFVRTILGKYTIETMIAVYCLLFMFFQVYNAFSLVLFLAVIALMIAQVLLIIISKKNLLIHDVMAFTVVVDKQSQMIFKSEEELIKYKKEFAEKNAKSKRTF